MKFRLMKKKDLSYGNPFSNPAWVHAVAYQKFQTSVQRPVGARYACCNNVHCVDLRESNAYSRYVTYLLQ